MSTKVSNRLLSARTEKLSAYTMVKYLWIRQSWRGWASNYRLWLIKSRIHNWV